MFDVKLFDELEALYPDSTQEGGVDAYALSACNGTYAGVHMLLTGLTPGMPVSIEVSGPNRAFKLFELLPVPVEVNTGARQRSAYLHNDVNETVIRKAPFYIYEALNPIYNLILPKTVSTAVKFSTAIEYVRQQCDAEWTFTVSHCGEKRVLHFTVHQYPCVVPKASKDTHQYVNWISYANVAKYHGLEMFSPAYNQMLQKYLRAAVFSRQNAINIPVTQCMRMEDGEVVLDEDKLLYYIRMAKEAGITYFQGDAFCGRASGLADNDEFYNSLDHEQIQHPEEVVTAFRNKAFELFDYGTFAQTSLDQKLIPGNGEESVRKQAKVLYDFIKKHNLENEWIQCCMDEPNDALADTYRILTDIVHESMPGIPLMEPMLPSHMLENTADILCPSADIYEQDKAYYDSLVEKGARLYVYTCLTPGGAYCNRMLDMQRLRQVWLGWAPAIYPNIEGFLHWGLNQYPNGDDPFHRSAVMFTEQVLEYHPKLPMFLPVGDFCILYPGYNQPLITTRSEAQRMGYEDLHLLQQLPDAAEFASQVFRGYADYTLDISLYRKTREELHRRASTTA